MSSLIRQVCLTGVVQRVYYERVNAEPSADQRPRHSIRVAARRTGLTAATLRAWERRYGAVHPARSGAERRLYSDADIERLRLMRELTAAGHGLAQLARLATDDLAALAREERAARTPAAPAPRDAVAAPRLPDDSVAATLVACERAVRALDGTELHRLLMRALVELGPIDFIERVAAPVCHRVGTLWEEAALSVAHEHVASVAIRQALDFLLDTVRGGATTRPQLIATTPPGQRHEFGAMMAAAVASLGGWNVTYLGPDVPVDDVVAAVRQTGARAVALSIVTGLPPTVVDELRRLREALGPGLTLIVGGRAAEVFAPVLDEIGARHVPELSGFRALLDAMLARPSHAA